MNKIMTNYMLTFSEHYQFKLTTTLKQKKHWSAVRLVRVRVHHDAGPGRNRGPGETPCQQHGRLRGVRDRAGEEGQASEGQI